MPTPQPPDHTGAIQEMVEIAVQADIRRGAIIFAAIDASAQTVREDIAAAQRTNLGLFQALRETQLEQGRQLTAQGQQLDALTDAVQEILRRLPPTE